MNSHDEHQVSHYRALLARLLPILFLGAAGAAVYVCARSADDVARLLDGAEPTLLATDPPYGVSLDPDSIHLPGIYVHRLVLNATPEKRIEKRTTRDRKV